MIRRYRPDLAILHFFGSADSDEVINECRKAGVPFALLNHYANSRFLNMPIRKHMLLASAVAGVSGLNIPKFTVRDFANLSDGVDIDFFQRAKASPVSNRPSSPVILLPARGVPEKGQLDLLRAAAIIHRRGTSCALAFAGPMLDPRYLREVHREISRLGLSKHVYFLGNLTIEQLRDWYAISTVVALPTRHDEGLPRILLEAQAMGVPVVAYATGGVPDGIQPGYTGYLVKTGDYRDLALRLEDVLSSDALHSNLAANCRATAERDFSLSALSVRHENFYRNILGRIARRCGER